MATYAIGDIHGRKQTFDALLSEIGFSESQDKLWLTGDLVNRGTDSLGVLRKIYAMRESIRAVAGNHDLHLLAAYLHRRSRPQNESLCAVLDAPDADELCNYLRSLPLLHEEGEYVLLHAGRLPEWDQKQAADLAAEAAMRLQADDDFFAAMYGDEPAKWHPALSADSRHRCIVNAFARLRILGADGGMILEYAGAPENIPQGAAPWFDFPTRRRWSSAAVCGHWSSLGLLLRRDILAIDTAHREGKLTAVRLEDRRVFQTPIRPADISAQ